jgi:hypothetical protein
MATERRVVRVSQAFFDQLDAQLPMERGPNGEPSAHDFVVIELPTIVERFATAFDSLPESLRGVDSARMLISSGLLVRAFAIDAALIENGAVELLGVTIER